MKSDRLASRLVCRACGAEPATDSPSPFRCPQADSTDDLDHLLRREADPADTRLRRALAGVVDGASGRPFADYRRLSHVYHRARGLGVDDASFLRIVAHLDNSVEAVDGGGFRATPFIPSAELSQSLGLAASAPVWVKDETGNVSGSHKGRHLMGVLLWLESVASIQSMESRAVDLGIASCGNAALAAAVLARAAGRRLRVFVPPDAHPNVLDRLVRLDANSVVCRRRPAESGDPCVQRFRVEARAGRVLPFTCQGTENGLVADGGETLAWEMVTSLRAAGEEIDTLFVQVGGGALASSVIQGLHTAVDLGLMRRIPRIHTVQTASASPLARAWRAVASTVLQRTPDLSCPSPTDPASDARCAGLIHDRVDSETLRSALDFAAAHRSRFMVPWPTEPRSLATGILDDETYDWHTVVQGMLQTGGWPITVSEERLEAAHRTAVSATGIGVEPTGSAGLAGLMELLETSRARRDERHAVLFTGIAR